ncbi:MAG: hypothetical protein WEC15_04385 [Flavobacteriales bacterium]
MRNPLFKSIDRYAAILLTVSITAWLEFSFTMEWSSPYCTSQEDGPGYAAFGMPLPYMQFGGASSLEYEFMPHAYFMNLVVLCALAFPVVRWMFRRSALAVSTRPRLVIGVVGSVLIAARAGLLALSISIGWLQPTASIGDHYEPYTDFRPVGFCPHDGHYECKPSPYWFPDGWVHD